MKIKMTAGISGADFALSPGDETDRFSAEEAARLIEAGFAVPVASRSKERATKKAPPESRG